MTPRALDAAVLDTLRQLNQEGEPDVLREVLAAFLADVPRRLAAVSDALTRRDAAALQREAHTLRGAAAQIGALAFESRCRELEALAKAGALDRASGLVRQIHAEFDHVSDEIKRLI